MACATERTAFDILGVNPGDDAATIRKAWRKLVRAYHPDTFQGDKAAANARLAELNAAYDAVTSGAAAKRDRGAEQAAEKARRQEAEAKRREAGRQRAEEQRRAQKKAEAEARAHARAEAARRAAAEDRRRKEAAAAARQAHRVLSRRVSQAERIDAARATFLAARHAMETPPSAPRRYV